MKKLTLGLGVILATMTISAHSANYNQFVSPSSLGKSVYDLNKKYQLGLSKSSENSDEDYYNFYNKDNSACGLAVGTNNKGIIQSISMYYNGNKCTMKSQSNFSFDMQRTTGIDILNQIKLSEMQVVVGCFNCPSGLELVDEMIINRPQDNYVTKFQVGSYNDEYKNFIAKKLFPKFNADDFDHYYEYMDKLDQMSTKPDFYNREDFKRQAIKAYNMKEKLGNITLELK